MSSNFGGGNGFATTFPQYSLGLTASYMIDFWGKNRATLYAAEENATAARYNREVVTLTAIVTVANSYFQILAAQDEPARRPPESRGGRAHFDTHQAAVCRRHRIAARRIATRGAGRHRTRGNSAP